VFSGASAPSSHSEVSEHAMKNSLAENYRTFLLITAATLSCTGAVAQNTSSGDLVIVTASRGPGIDADVLGGSFSLITAEDMKLRQTQVVSDILRDVPGIAVSRAGTVGSITSVRLRGSEANHALVMIDGMEAGDPFQGEFDFSTLIADDVAKIEVLRGQQSALYGSDAIGGVIHYITATGAEAPGISARTEGGSFGTAAASARVAGVDGAFDYAINASYYNTGGVKGSRFGTRELGSRNAALSGKFTYALAENLSVTAVARYQDLDADTEPQDFNFPINPATFGFAVDGLNSTKAKTLYGLVRGDLALLDGQWLHALTLQAVDGARKNYDDFGVLSSETVGLREKASYVSTYKFGTDIAAHALIFAADFKRETYRNKDVFGFPLPMNDKRSLENTGLVGEYDLTIGDRIGFGAAVRHDINDYFDSATTYRLQGSYRVMDHVRLRAALGSGVKNPTNYELFGFDPVTYLGNPNLKPERSEGWEAGVEIGLFEDRVLIGGTYFNTRLEDELFTVFLPGFISTTDNRVTGSKSQGFEFTAGLRLDKEWRIDAAWTNVHALEAGQQELRRAPNIASLNVSWRAPDDRFGANLTIRYNGEQQDSNFTLAGPPRVTLESYTLVNLGGDYRINDVFEFYGRVENLTDEKYEEVYTFPTSGRAIYAGVKAAF
jgi:vitamin B12 transporter